MTDVNTNRILPTVIDIVNKNGKTGIGDGPQMMLVLKAKKSELTSIFLTSSADSKGANGLSIYELRNFDISTSPTN